MGFLDWVMSIGCALFVGGMLYAMINNDMKRRGHLKELSNSGFSIDHLLQGSLIAAFDDKRRRLAFIGYNGVVQYDYAKVTSWEWTWTEHNGTHTADYLHFYLLDKKNPLVKIKLDRSVAEHWHAKLNAILRG